jgi:dienelactone hydrolase
MASELRCPLLAFFGDQDQFVPMDDVRALERELARRGARPPRSWWWRVRATRS